MPPLQLGRSSLMVAMMFGDEAVVKALVERGADVNDSIDLGVPVEISARTNRERVSDLISGIFEPTPTLSNGRCVYVKRSDDSMCLHYSPNNSWMVSVKTCVGDTDGFASFECAPGMQPELCEGVWRVVGDQRVSIQPSIAGPPVREKLDPFSPPKLKLIPPQLFLFSMFVLEWFIVH